MPGPSSATAIAARSAADVTVTVTVRSANLRALSMRLPTACASRSGSAVTVTGLAVGSKMRAVPSWSARGWRPATVRPTTTVASTGRMWRANRLASSRARSRRSADQSFEASGVAADDLAGVGRVGDRAVPERLGVAGDGGERGSQVVGHRHQELLIEGPGSLEVGRHAVDRSSEITQLVGSRTVDPHREVTVRDRRRCLLDLGHRGGEVAGQRPGSTGPNRAGRPRPRGRTTAGSRTRWSPPGRVA